MLFGVNKTFAKNLKIIFTILIFISFLLAGKFLVIYDIPQKVDVIVVLSGESGRIEQGLNLFHSGYAENLILSNSNAFITSNNLIMNIPKNHLFLEDKATSTYENAFFTKEIMDDQHFESAIVISTDYHMRRVKMNFNRVFKNDNTQLLFIGSKTGYISNFWWSQKHSLKMTIAEYVKIIGNVLGIHGSEAKLRMYKLKEWFLHMVIDKF